ncbi:MAG TPA: hypothetical protein VGD98_23240 [Ktedonobacteraceae bacterium]
MSIIEEAIQNSGSRFTGGQSAPVGSYWSPRVNCIFQQIADGTLPQCGIFIQITSSGTSTLAQCATAINALVSGLGYTAGTLHTYTTADLLPYPGQSTNDG